MSSLSSCLSRRSPPPSSTLFPYTTLFRSRTLSAFPPRDYRGGGRRRAGRSRPPFGGTFGAARGGNPVQCRERKSTRLNSRHLVISYGALCVNKKQTPQPPSQEGRSKQRAA